MVSRKIVHCFLHCKESKHICHKLTPMKHIFFLYFIKVCMISSKIAVCFLDCREIKTHMSKNYSNRTYFPSYIYYTYMYKHTYITQRFTWLAAKLSIDSCIIKNLSTFDTNLLAVKPFFFILT